MVSGADAGFSSPVFINILDYESLDDGKKTVNKRLLKNCLVVWNEVITFVASLFNNNVYGSSLLQFHSCWHSCRSGFCNGDFG